MPVPRVQESLEGAAVPVPLRRASEAAEERAEVGLGEVVSEKREGLADEGCAVNTGAVALIDALGFRGIWGRYKSDQVLVL
jgi:hypothetical protein